LLPGADDQRRIYAANLKRWIVHGHGRNADARVCGIEDRLSHEIAVSDHQLSEIDAWFIKNQTVGQMLPRGNGAAKYCEG
jgi:hypothetical protein